MMSDEREAGVPGKQTSLVNEELLLGASCHGHGLSGFERDF